jgi:hypothetical protein
LVAQHVLVLNQPCAYQLALKTLEQLPPYKQLPVLGSARMHSVLKQGLQGYQAMLLSVNSQYCHAKHTACGHCCAAAPCGEGGWDPARGWRGDSSAGGVHAQEPMLWMR